MTTTPIPCKYFKQKLTADYLARVKADTDLQVSDTEVAGYHLRYAAKTGGKVFYLHYVLRFDGKRIERNMKLGSFPELTAPAARAEAIKCRGLVLGGVDPMLERKERLRRMIGEQDKKIPFKVIMEKYLEEHSKVFKKPETSRKEFQMARKHICDDGRNVAKHVEPESQDFLFSCPPYFDLEVYSDRTDDASNQPTYGEFFGILDKAFSDAIACLKDNSFAAIVVANIRDKKTGAYRNFVDDIIRLFQRNGMSFYNDIVLINAFTSGPLRAERNMRNRKVVKTHQNVLVFYKGDIGGIRENFSDTDVFIDHLSEYGDDDDNGEA